MNKVKSCRLCGSLAINEHLHGRTIGVRSDLCDVCYWREAAADARLAVRMLEMFYQK